MDEGLYERRRTAFGSMAETYDRYRPDWPAHIAAWLIGTEPAGPLAGRAGLDEPDGQAGLDVLDLGAGTGKLTRTLAGLGHRVAAVDPSEGMLAVFTASRPQMSTGISAKISALVGTGERIPLPDASVDAVTVAQAWHWMRPAEAGTECARVLRPGGVLGLGWNARADDRPWLRELDDLIRDQANEQSRAIREQPENLRVPSPFGPVQAKVFTHETRVDPAGVVALASSFSYVAIRDDREEVLAKVDRLARAAADPDGRVTIPYRTYCYRAQLPT